MKANDGYVGVQSDPIAPLERLKWPGLWLERALDLFENGARSMKGGITLSVRGYIVLKHSCGGLGVMGEKLKTFA